MFDRYTAAIAPSWGRRALAIASVALHVSAGIVLVIYSIMYIEEVTPPAVSLRFFSVAPSSAPPAASNHHKSKREPKPVTNALIPTAASKLVEPKPKEPIADSDDQTNDDGPGDSQGPPGPPGPPGVPGGPPDGKPNNTAERKIRDAAAFTLLASRVRADLPHLPEWFTAQHPKQTVHGTFRICLDTSGHVSDVSTILSIAGNVDGALMQQIKDNWLYRPQALPVCFAQPFSFHID
jgi:hypothetical protein